MLKMLVGVIAVAGLFLMKGDDKRKRGIRNNNAGNLKMTGIKWNGKVPHDQNTDGTFEQFFSSHFGLRAMFMDIRGDIEKDGLKNITLLINEYAPTSDKNNTAAYIASVSKQLGIGPNEQIEREHYLGLMKAIIRHENGEQPYSDEQILEAMAAA